MTAKGAPRRSHAGRRSARRYAVQALYQWQLTGQDGGLINAQFLLDHDMSRTDVAYFQELLNQTVAKIEPLSGALQPYLDRPFAQVDPVEKAILWVAGYELMHRLDVPYRVAINEAVELAKRFGAEQSHRFINGVLDRAAKTLRPVENPQL